MEKLIELILIGGTMYLIAVAIVFILALAFLLYTFLTIVKGRL